MSDVMIKEVVIYHNFKRPPSDAEAGGGKSKVEADGYIPAHILIRDMIAAGERLSAARKERFDFPDEESIDPNFMDPTRSGSFDMADASELGSAAIARIKKADAEEKKRLAEEAAAKKQEEKKPEEK